MVLGGAGDHLGVGAHQERGPHGAHVCAPAGFQVGADRPPTPAAAPVAAAPVAAAPVAVAAPAPAAPVAAPAPTPAAPVAAAAAAAAQGLTFVSVSF